jgi:phage baseplate assembly protein gpV
VSLTAASVSLTGNLAVTGNITATGIIAAGNPPVSLTTHNHGGSPPVAPS